MKKKYKNPKVVAIDFDETIGLYRPEDNGRGYIVKHVDSTPNPRIVRYIKELRKRGVRVIVWTSRWWGDYNSLARWFKKHGIKVDDIVCGRLKADAYICDKAINAHDPRVEAKVDLMLDNSHSWGKHFHKAVKRGK